MANIEKNIDKKENENSEKKKIPSINDVKQRVQKLSWWARLFLFCFFSFIFIIFSVLIAINTPFVKNWAAERAITYINNEFKTKFATEKVEINFFGDVVITGLTAKDHRNNEFLKVKELTAHSDWLAIAFNSRDLKFQKLSVDGIDLKVITYKGEDQDNFTKYIEKFDDGKPRDPNKKPFQLTSRIEIKNGKVSIVNENQGEDGKWLKAENFNAYVSELKVMGSDVKLKLHKIGFITERWGKKHHLKAISGDVFVTKEKFELKDLIFHTDHSLLQGDLVFNLDKKTGWKDFNDKVVWDMNLKRGSYLDGYDISYFVKNWDNYQKYNLYGKMDGSLNDFTLKNFLIKVKDNEIYAPEIRLAKLLEGNFNIKTNKISADLTYKGLKTSLPKFISYKMGNFADDFGRLKYNGFADINKERVIAKGELVTGIGQAKINSFSLRNYSSQLPEYAGNLILKDLNTSILSKNKQVGLVSGNFNIQGKGFDINTLSLKTKSHISSIELMGKKLTNIVLDGDLTRRQFNGTIDIDDAQARGVVAGKIDFSTPRLFADIKGEIDHLNLSYFGANDGGNSIFKGRVDGRVSMTNINDLDLNATITDVALGGKQNISIPNGQVKIAFENGNRVIDVDMPDAVKGKISGKFNLGDLGEIFQQSLDRILAGNKVRKYYKGQNFTMDFDINQKLVDYFEPNARINDGIKVVGSFDGNSNNMLLDIKADKVSYLMTKQEEISEADQLMAKLNPNYTVRPSLKVEDITADNINLKLNTANPKEYWTVKVGRVKYKDSVLKDANINAENENDNKLKIAVDLLVGTELKEKNNTMTPYAAKLEQSINSDGDYMVKFDPTNLKIENFIWMVDTSPELNHYIVYRKKTKDFKINNLKLYSDDSEILINGIFKDAKDFDLSADLRDMDLSKVMAIVSQDNKIDIKGLANGSIKLRMDKNHLEPIIDVRIDDIVLNNNKIGDLLVGAQSNADRKNVYNVEAKIVSSEWFGDDKLALSGIIDNNTQSPTLDLTAKMKEFDIDFVQFFVKDIFSNFRGKASGDIKINGTVKDLNYGGDIAMKDFGLKLNFSGVDYTFDDTVVTVSNGNLIFNLVGVKDSRNNSKGMISIGRLSLSDLSNIGADLLIRADDLMLLNTEQKDFDTFWGMIYSQGDIFVGFEKNTLKIDAKAKVLDNSIFTLNSSSASTSGDEFKMLRFLELNEEGKVKIADKKKTSVAMDINLDITADKTSTVNVLLGDEVGNITVRGATRNMKFKMDKTGNMAMRGQYIVDTGSYISKAILEKEFNIKKGSNINWSGDVMNPDLNITANYNTIVSNMGEYLNVGNLPAVNVELQTKITNRLTKPDIKPIIYAPDVSSQIREVMNSKLATEEEKTLQFASILALGSFNTSVSSVGLGANLFLKQLTNAFNNISKDLKVDITYITGSQTMNTSGRANASLSYTISPRLTVKAGTGVPLATSSNTRSNYLSGEGIIEYDLSKKNDGSLIGRAYSKPSNVGLVLGSSAGANQTYGGGIVWSYSFNRIIPLRKQKNKTQLPKNDSIKEDSLK